MARPHPVGALDRDADFQILIVAVMAAAETTTNVKATLLSTAMICTRPSATAKPM
jgi:hypothetical protein